MPALRWPGGEWRIDRDVVTIGRGPDNVVPIPDAGISRYHAQLLRTAQGWEVVDNGSQNGLLVSGAAVPSGGRRALRSGDRLQLGATVLEFVDELDPGDTVAMPKH